jgi:GT2 family glycosyltransferase
MPTEPRLSVLLVTRGRPDHLLAMLATLRRVVVPTDYSAELVLIINDKTTPVESLAPEMPFSVRTLHHPRPGKSAALNVAAAEAKGQILFFTDDDVRLPADWLIALAGPILAGRLDAIGGGVRIPAALERSWMTPLHRAYLAETDYATNSENTVLTGASMAIARTTMERLGGFDPNLGPGALGFGDDTLLTERIRAAGGRIGFSPTYVDHHFDPSRLSREAFLDAAKRRGRSAAYIAHHWEGRKLNWLGLRQLRHRLRMTLRKATGVEHATEHEMHDQWTAGFFEQYQIERVKPPRYFPRATS